MSREDRVAAGNESESGRVVDLTGPGQYNMLNEGRDDRRYQWSWWLPLTVVILIGLAVIALVVFS